MTSTMSPPASPPASPSAQPTAAVRRVGVAAVAALACAGFATFAGVPAAHAVTPTATTVTFSYTGGAQYYTVPAGVNALQVTLTGAAGGSVDYPGLRSAGGLGAVVTATLPVGPDASVHAGDVLVTQVGGAGEHAQSLEYNDNSNLAGGYNGGGDGGYAGEWANYHNAHAGYGGGGASDIRLPGGALSDRVVVAAGGGGGTSFGGAGGDAGQDAPQNSVFGGWDAGGAGTQTRGGWHATGYSDSGAGTDGSFGQGGVGGSAAYESEGGGGGGGYYGGGGGAADDFGGTGGGGGSSYTDPAASGVTVATTTAAAAASVSITAVPDVPTITAHPDVTASATSAAGATVAYTTPTASDPLDGSDPVTCIPAAGATFPIGSTTVSCTTQNQSGNSAASTFTVTVADTTKPVLATHPDITATATSAAGAAVTYTSPGASDNVDGTDPVTCTPPSGATFPVGSSTVTCTTRDKAANTATSTFTVTVTAAPVPNKADLKVTVSGPASTTHGAKATYTVTVSNTGPAAASAVTTGLATTGLGAPTSVGATSGTVKVAGLTVTGTVWKLPTLASGASSTFTVTGIVTATAGHPVTAATATLATTPDPNLANNYALTTTRTTT